VSDTVKTVLIVGGVAVGAFVLFKALTPTSKVTVGTKTTSGTDIALLTGLVGLGKGLLDSFSSTEAPNEGTYRVDTGFNIVGNTLTDDKGATLVYGTD
jgi:hypothetical protein